MPRIKVTSPDGQTAIITAPEGASQEEIKAYAQQQFATKSADPVSPVIKGASNLIMSAADPGLRATAEDMSLLGGGNEVISALKAGGQMVMDPDGPGFMDRFNQNLQQKNELKRMNAERHPAMNLAANVVPSLASGLGVAKLFNPKTWKAASALAGGEGAVTGFLSEEPGNRGKGASYGVATGASAGVLSPLVTGLTRAGAKAVKGVRNIVSGYAPETAEQAEKSAMEFLSNHFQRLGMTPEEALAKSKEVYSKNDTLADVTNKYSRELTGGVAAHPAVPVSGVDDLLDMRTAASKAQEGAMALKEKSLVNNVTRRKALGEEQLRTVMKNAEEAKASDSVVERVRTAFGADSTIVRKGVAYVEDITKSRRKVGSRIARRIKETEEVPLSNQEELQGFLKYDLVKGIKKRAAADMEPYGLDLKYPETSTPEIEDLTKLLDDAVLDDANEPIITEALADHIGKNLQDQIDVARKEGRKGATWMELKRQWNDLVYDGTTDDTLKTLRAEYGVLSRTKDAFTDGAKEYPRLKESDLIKKLAGMDTSQKSAFSKGVLAGYADEGDGLLKKLGDEKERRKIGLIFGPGKVEQASDIVKTERGLAASAAEKTRQLAEKTKTNTAGMVDRLESSTERRLSPLKDKAEQYGSLSEAISAGRSTQARGIAKDTLAGDLEGIDTLYKRLEGKRAYGVTGAIGMAVNEVIGIINQTHMSDEAVNVLFKKLSTQGPEINRIMKEIGETIMPQAAKEKALKESMKLLAKQLTSASGAVVGGLVPRVTTGYFD